MVKSAQDVAGDDAAAALNGSAMWGIFLQAEMVDVSAIAGNRPATSAASRMHYYLTIPPPLSDDSTSAAFTAFRQADFD